jgi:arylsulfatase A-like enzyme
MKPIVVQSMTFFQSYFRWLLPIILVGLFDAPLSAQDSSTRPNILVIVADDLGWADLGCYGSRFYETPQLDSLAKKGVRFTNGYASSPVCSPTRASLLTGKYPVKTGVTDWIKGRQAGGKARSFEKLLGPPTAYALPLAEQTMAEMAISQGYQTFFAGKWHLGEEPDYWPEAQGFSKNIGGWSAGSPTGRKNDSTGGFFTPYANPRLTDGPVGEYLTDRLTDETIRFLENKSSDPFVIFYSLYAVHNPMQAPAALVSKYEAKRQRLGLDDKQRFSKEEDWMRHQPDWKNRMQQDHPVYAAMIENMDWNIGRLFQKLRDLSLDENTLIIFTSDNGGLRTAEGSVTSNAPLRAGKGWLYEGGIRVPLILYMKGIYEDGKTCETPVNSVDLFPSMASLINPPYKKPAELDGIPLQEIMEQPKRYYQRKLYWHYPHYSNQGGRPSAAIRKGKYKLIYYYEDEQLELFDLKKDESERKDLSRKKGKKTRRMYQWLCQWLKATDAAKPGPNPQYSVETHF